MFKLEKSLIITQDKGIHFRSLLKLKEICESCKVDVVLYKESTNKSANLTNGLDVLLLCTVKNDEVLFIIKGDSAEHTQEAYRQLYAAIGA